MPRDRDIIFSDLTGKLDALRITCGRCGNAGAGHYRLEHLITARGRHAKIADWLAEVAAGCPQRARNCDNQCGAQCSDLIGIGWPRAGTGKPPVPRLSRRSH